MTAFVPVAGDSMEIADGFGGGGLPRPIVIGPPECPVELSGRLELRLADSGGATLLLHGSYEGHGDDLRRDMHGGAFRFLARAAAELDPVQARLRCRLRHPSMGGTG